MNLSLKQLRAVKKRAPPRPGWGRAYDWDYTVISTALAEQVRLADDAV